MCPRLLTLPAPQGQQQIPNKSVNSTIWHDGVIYDLNSFPAPWRWKHSCVWCEWCHGPILHDSSLSHWQAFRENEAIGQSDQFCLRVSIKKIKKIMCFVFHWGCAIYEMLVTENWAKSFEKRVLEYALLCVLLPIFNFTHFLLFFLYQIQTWNTLQTRNQTQSFQDCALG